MSGRSGDRPGWMLLFEGAVAGAVAPLLFLAGLRRIGETRTAVLSLSEPLAATLLAAVMLGQWPAPSQLLGAALLMGASIAVQVVPARGLARTGGRSPGAGDASVVSVPADRAPQRPGRTVRTP